MNYMFVFVRNNNYFILFHVKYFFFFLVKYSFSERAILFIIILLYKVMGKVE